MRKSSFKAMLATISLLGVVPVSVNALTNHHSSINHSIIPFAKVSLDEAIKVRNIKGEEANDADSVLAYVIKVTDDPNLSISDIQIAFFSKATEIGSGSVAIIAKDTSNYIGFVAITIESLPKIDLNNVITAKEVKGEDAPNAEVLLKELKNVNPRLAIEDVEIKGFEQATEISEGKAVVVAKEDTKYTGEVAITLRVMPKIDLKDVIGIREVEATVANSEDNIIAAVAEINNKLDLNDVELGDFRAASESAPGFAQILAKDNTKYTGEVNIIINPLPKTILGEVITKQTVSGKQFNEAQDVLDEVVKLNPDLDVSSVEVTTFIKATNVTNGSMIISATPTGKYKGLVGISIERLTDTFFLSKDDNNEQQVVAAINDNRFSKSITLSSTVDRLAASIDTKFIKDRLVEEDANLIEDNLFTVNKIFDNQGNDLVDNDLTTSRTSLVVVNYNYGSIKNQSFELMLSVKQIARSQQRSSLLTQIKNKADKNEDDNEWTDAWLSYFKQLQTDIRSFSFQFPRTDLNQNKVLQSIIYDEIKLVMETDFKAWQIEKGYDPNSVAITYTNFNLNETSKELSVKGRLSIKIQSYGSYVQSSILFNYKIGFNVV